MKAYIAVTALVTLFLPSFSVAQPAIGFWGGLNRANLIGDTPPDTRYAPRRGWTAGITGEFNLAKDVKLSLQPMYLQRGTRIAFEVPREDEPRDSLSVRLDYYSLPAMIKVISGNGKIYVSSGVDLSVLSGAKL